MVKFNETERIKEYSVWKTKTKLYSGEKIIPENTVITNIDILGYDVTGEKYRVSYHGPDSINGIAYIKPGDIENVFEPMIDLSKEYETKIIYVMRQKHLLSALTLTVSIITIAVFFNFAYDFTISRQAAINTIKTFMVMILETFTGIIFLPSFVMQNDEEIKDDLVKKIASSEKYKLQQEQKQKNNNMTWLNRYLSIKSINNSKK